MLPRPDGFPGTEAEAFWHAHRRCRQPAQHPTTKPLRAKEIFNGDGRVFERCTPTTNPSFIRNASLPSTTPVGPRVVSARQRDWIGLDRLVHVPSWTCTRSTCTNTTRLWSRKSRRSTIKRSNTLLPPRHKLRHRTRRTTTAPVQVQVRVRVRVLLRGCTLPINPSNTSMNHSSSHRSSLLLHLEPKRRCNRNRNSNSNHRLPSQALSPHPHLLTITVISSRCPVSTYLPAMDLSRPCRSPRRTRMTRPRYYARCVSVR